MKTKSHTEGVENVYWDNPSPTLLPLPIPQSRTLPSSWAASVLTKPPSASRNVCNTRGTPRSSRPLLLNFPIPFPFSLHTPHRAFESQRQLFTSLFPSLHLCSSGSLYFENSFFFFFNCSQADNHSSRTSFSLEPPGTHTTVRSPLPTRLCHVLKERDAEELNTESPRDTEEREFPEVPLEIWLIYLFTC